MYHCECLQKHGILIKSVPSYNKNSYCASVFNTQLNYCQLKITWIIEYLKRNYLKKYCFEISFIAWIHFKDKSINTLMKQIEIV